ncbi:MAG: prepilin-type N-terminal cleavage/methylation domain-containing protein, partial [Akkermansiaceae bacterium]|nr:prepilin-type N-terminal cleavage/methylation domain-containing protein [Akkermansiaceae bacterium]
MVSEDPKSKIHPPSPAFARLRRTGDPTPGAPRRGFTMVEVVIVVAVIVVLVAVG